jgi:RimJ/RimL family protein N-acetyltransferase
MTPSRPTAPALGQTLDGTHPQLNRDVAGDGHRRATLSLEGATTADQPVGAALEGRWIALQPSGRDHLGFLYGLAIDPATSYRWRLRGGVPPMDVFEKQLWQSVLAQFLLVTRKQRQPVGQVVAFNVNLNAGHVSAGIVTTRRAAGSAFAIEGLAVFLRYLFATYSLRKVYFEVPEYNVAQFASVLRRYAKQEGRLEEYDYYDGRYWDSLILSVDRTSPAATRLGLPRSEASDGNGKVRRTAANGTRRG